VAYVRIFETGTYRMQRYQVVVNGNTYNVTVRSLVGNMAVVDVDGWEFQVAIAGDDGVRDFSPAIAAATGSALGMKTSATPPPLPKKSESPKNGASKKRSSALEQLTPKKSATSIGPTESIIAAHLPGQIMEIMVKVGDTIRKGDTVCKMEAMKMLNEVLAIRDGVIKEILVKEQQNVLENQPLMIIG
jgi:biotin carboxyl carrier protein